MKVDVMMDSKIDEFQTIEISFYLIIHGSNILQAGTNFLEVRFKEYWTGVMGV